MWALVIVNIAVGIVTPMVDVATKSAASTVQAGALPSTVAISATVLTTATSSAAPISRAGEVWRSSRSVADPPRMIPIELAAKSSAKPPELNP